MNLSFLTRLPNWVHKYAKKNLVYQFKLRAFVKHAFIRAHTEWYIDGENIMYNDPFWNIYDKYFNTSIFGFGKNIRISEV